MGKSKNNQFKAGHDSIRIKKEKYFLKYVRHLTNLLK